MKKILFTFIALLLASPGATFARPAKDRNIPVRLFGEAVGYTATIPATENGTTEALCFDLDLLSLRTGRKVGTATDCLADITPVGDGLSVVATTFFNGPAGQLVSRGLTTVQPTTIGSVDFTHVTGSIPSAGDNNILSGTGRYAKASGPVRLSGAVNMSKLETEGKIKFDCIFVIDLD